jgi:hypothetical protein
MKLSVRSFFLLVGLCGVCLILSEKRSTAGIIYVDNRRGSDAFDGSNPDLIDTLSGPVKSIRRATLLAKPSDTIFLTKTGIPYSESISLTGRRHSGIDEFPFRIVGNGSIVDGSRPVPAGAWKRIDTDLWKMTPWRKGHYLLLRGFQPLPEHRLDSGSVFPVSIPPGSWSAIRGSIYYKSKPLEQPEKIAFRVAYHSVGLTFYKVHNVEIRDITFRHFRLDGLNAHDLSKKVKLINVKSLANGRAGLAVGGSSHVAVDGGDLTGNLRHSVLITELGGVNLKDTKMTQEPTIIKK